MSDLPASRQQYQDGQMQLLDVALPESGHLQQLSEGVYWCRMPLPMALDHINLYVLEEEDGWTLIDTGMHLPDTLKHWQSIFAAYFSEKPVKQVIVTHMHPDHVGNAGWICEHWRCPLYMTEAEYFATRSYTSVTELGWQSEAFYRQAGLGDDYIHYIQKRIGFGAVVSSMPSAYRRLAEGDELTIAGQSWRIIIGRGHCFAHACLYNDERKILLAGDQILPLISPNVSIYATEPEASPLASWFDSLQALLQLPAETLVLPAHNQAFYGLHERVAELQQHHEKQCHVILDACQTAKKPTELLTVLFGRDIGFADMGLALGECKAHLKYLLDQKALTRSWIDDVEYYQTLNS